MRCCVIFFMGNSLSDLKTLLISVFGKFTGHLLISGQLTHRSRHAPTLNPLQSQ